MLLLLLSYVYMYVGRTFLVRLYETTHFIYFHFVFFYISLKCSWYLNFFVVYPHLFLFTFLPHFSSFFFCYFHFEFGKMILKSCVVQLKYYTLYRIFPCYFSFCICVSISKNIKIRFTLNFIVHFGILITLLSMFF